MQYDYLIVGAGSAGATLAGRLSENPDVQVVLIEAGPDWRGADAPAALRSANPSVIINAPDFAEFRYDDLEARRTKSQEHRLYWRGRGLGGSSTINGQIAIRGVASDYDRWSEWGCAGWSFEEVLPAFNRLETDLRYGGESYHGDDGPIPIDRAPVGLWGPVDQSFAEAALDAGHHWAADHNAPEAIGVSPYAINSRHGARVTTNDGYLDPHRGRNNLTIYCNAGVDKVLFDGVSATGVLTTDGAKISADCVVLCAGAVHSPAILMRSGIGPADDLGALDIEVRADLPVGRGFQDHPIAALPIVLKADAVVEPNFRHTNCCVRYSSGLAGAGSGDMMMISMNRLGDGLGRNNRAPSTNFGMIGVWVNECFSRGVVKLASNDPARQPVIEENMLDDARDLERMRDGVKRLLDIANHHAIDGIAELVATGPEGESFRTLTSDAAIDDWTMRRSGDAQHATSTCRMGDPKHAMTVVDPHCQVLGLDNLRVIDASVMPAVPCANTHLTTVMIAEHMAARLIV